MIGID